MMVHRLDHRKVRLPKPTDELFDGMAQVGYREYLSVYRSIYPKSEVLVWENVSDEMKIMMRSGMRAVWKHLAKAGGAKEISGGPTGG